MYFPGALARVAILVVTIGVAASQASAQEKRADTADDAQPPPVESGASEEPHDAEAASAAVGGPRALIELKRQDTSRGTPSESTKTTLKLERYFTGPVTMLRLELPFPDEKTDFGGSPFNPKLGDIKVRARFRSLEAGAHAFSPFVEVTFPTADPESLGTGKYQLSAGIRMLSPLTLPFNDPAAHKSRFEAEAQQVNSVGGDPATKNINYTKFEFTLYDIWQRTYTLKLKVKPVVDWNQGGDTGAVGEVEVGMFFARDWRTWLMLGHRLWGPSSIPSTYESRVEIGVSRTF